MYAAEKWRAIVVEITIALRTPDRWTMSIAGTVASGSVAQDRGVER
jgi:hypothetical protein